MQLVIEAPVPTEIIKRFLKNNSLTIVEASRRMGYSDVHVYNVLNGKSPLTDAFVGCFYRTFVSTRSPFFLQGADNVLQETVQNIAQ